MTGGPTIVVAFDMCSSSNIIDDLWRSKNVQPLTAFYDALQRYLTKAQKITVPFDLYKFTGDGWLLLFPANTDGVRLLRFLEDLCLFFAVEFRQRLLPHLSPSHRLSASLLVSRKVNWFQSPCMDDRNMLAGRSMWPADYRQRSKTKEVHLRTAR